MSRRHRIRYGSPCGEGQSRLGAGVRGGVGEGYGRDGDRGTAHAGGTVEEPERRGPRFGFGATANTLLGYTLVKGLQMTLHNLIFPLYAYSLGYDLATIGRLNATAR
jgi:hypothetical protein